MNWTPPDWTKPHQNRKLVKMNIKIGIVGIVFVAGIIFLIAQVTGGVYNNYSDGERTGVITKISKKGLIWKSWEGDMLVGGMAKDDDGTMVPATWHFSLSNTPGGNELAAKISEKSAAGGKVTLHYNQWWIKPIALSTDYQITGIIESKAETKP